MQTIWKASLQNDVEQAEGHLLATVRAPRDAKFLHAAVQFTVSPTIWFSCDPDAAMVDHRLALVPTGGTVPEAGEYVATFLQEHGTYVWHVYVLQELPH